MTRPPFRAGRPERLVAILAVVVLATAAGCGKKGAPLAPLVRLPVAPESFGARRQGDQVTIQLRIPAANTDGSTPAQIRRVDVYGYTGASAAEETMADDGTVVASIPVRPPQEPAPEGSAKVEPRPPGSMEQGFDQGDTVTVTETIGDAQREPAIPRKHKKKETAAPVAQEQGFNPSLGTAVEIAPPLGPPPPNAATRFYGAVGVGNRGRKGEFTPPVGVSLLPPPAPPASVSVAYDEKTVIVSWEPPPGARQPTLPEPAPKGLLEAKPLGLPSAAATFNVYLAAAPAPPPPAEDHPAGSSAAAPPAPAPAPVNAAPLGQPRFQEPVPAPGTTRCYVVTTVASSAGGSLESAPSDPACTTLRDTFPPPAPKGLAAVGSAGAISLIWERVESADLAGYLVMRSEPGGQPLALSTAPITEATFRDERVKRGVVYTYVVIAVDKSGNRSEPSNAVEESAR